MQKTRHHGKIQPAQGRPMSQPSSIHVVPQRPAKSLLKTLCGYAFPLILGIQTMSQPAQADVQVTVSPSPVKIFDYTTKLGIKGWHVETPDIPVLTLAVTFKEAGDKNDPQGLNGVAEFLSGMLDEGAGNYDSVKFKELLLEKNIRLGLSQNSDSFTITMRGTKDNIQDMFDILTLILTKPRFDHDAFNRVKEQILTSLSQNLHSENAVAGDTFNKQAFAGHPYSHTTQNAIDGTRKIKREHLIQFMKDYLTIDKIQVVSAGDISSQDIETKFDSALKDLPASGQASTVGFADLKTTGGVTVVDMDIPQSVVLFYQPGLDRKDKDFYAAYIMNSILGDGMFKSRLWDEIRENRGLAYGISSSLQWTQHSNYIIGSTATANKDAGEVVKIIREEWQKMKDAGANQKELDFVRERMVGSYPLGFTSTPQIVGLMKNYMTDGLPTDFINNRNDLIRAVTLDDVNRVAKSLLQPEKLSFIIVGKPEGLPKDGEKK